MSVERVHALLIVKIYAPVKGPGLDVVVGTLEAGSPMLLWLGRDGAIVVDDDAFDEEGPPAIMNGALTKPPCRWSNTLPPASTTRNR